MPTTTQLDHDRVALMAGLGFTPEQIEDRLDCSARQVRRILADRQIDVQPNPILGTDEERPIVWEQLRDAGYSYQRIAYVVGRTRQAVRAYFTQQNR